MKNLGELRNDEFYVLGKVRVSGPGIEHGVLSTFQSHFICETKGAGNKFEFYTI
jgi:hypothetical protein